MACLRSKPFRYKKKTQYYLNQFIKLTFALEEVIFMFIFNNEYENFIKNIWRIDVLPF